MATRKVTPPDSLGGAGIPGDASLPHPRAFPSPPPNMTSTRGRQPERGSYYGWVSAAVGDLGGAAEPICPEGGLRITAAELMPLDQRWYGAWEAGILGLAVVAPSTCLAPGILAGGPVGVWTLAGLALLSEPIVWCACLVYWIRQRRRVVMADSGQAYVGAFAVTCVSIAPIVLSMVL